MHKKGWSALLAVVLVVGMCLPAWASDDLPYTVYRASDDFGRGGYIVNNTGRTRGNIQDFGHLAAVRPGTEYFLPLRAQDFEWETERDVYRPTSLPLETAKQLRFELRLEYEEGEQVFDYIDLVARGDQLGILIDFADVHHSVERVRFCAKAQLCSMGAPIEGWKFRVEGNFANRNRLVYSPLSTIPLGIGRQASGKQDVYGVTFDLGHGINLTGDLLFGGEAYGVVSEKPTEEDKALMQAHPQIVRVLHLTTIGLSGRVRIDMGESGALYVYSADLGYLGTTSDEVRLARTYYLTSEKL